MSVNGMIVHCLMLVSFLAYGQPRETLVYRTVADGSLEDCNWDDAETPHANAHYRIAPGGALRSMTVGVPTTDGEEGEYRFPGESLTIGNAESSYRVSVDLLTPRFVVPSLIFAGRSRVDCQLTGEIVGNIEANANAGTSLDVWKQGMLKIDGDVSGTGLLILCGKGQGSANPGGYFEFCGDNSGFAGRLNITMTSGNGGLTPSAYVDQHGRRHFTTVYLNRGSDLGGPMPEVTTNGVRIGECTELITRSTVSFDEPTRGFSLEGLVRFNVTNAEHEVVLGMPLTLAGSVWKEGEGTLVFANGRPTVATNSALVVKSGAVRCRKSRALDGVRVVLEGDDAELRFDANATDGELVRFGIVNLLEDAVPFAHQGSGDGIPIAVDWKGASRSDEKRMALFTVRSKYADIVENSLRPRQMDPFQDRIVGFERDEVVLDGVPCVTIFAKRQLCDVFIRSQFKYGLERSDFIHKWYDRPLMQDTSYQAANENGHFINIESWKRHAEIGRLCGHGFAAFISTSGRSDVIERSVLPGYESVILTEMLGEKTLGADTRNQLDTCIRVAEQALAMTNSYRIGGRIILTSYSAVTVNQLDFHAEVKRILDARYPGKFAVMPYFNPYSGKLADLSKPVVLDQIAEDVRTVLRTVDGLCLEPSSLVFDNRRSHPDAAIEYVAPVIRSVLAEPEFSNRPFGLVAHLGHENCYRWNYVYDCTGTKIFRDWLKLARAFRPDFILGAEWDEENENTHHRPTVATGFTHQRLLRYSTSVLNNLAPSVYPGDDTTRPNLVVSYRKSVLLGEPLEVEVLNIPDGTFAGATFDVTLRWLNEAGSVVKTYAAHRLEADRLEAAWFTSPAADLFGSQVLHPEVTVASGGHSWVFDRQLWPVSLHANRQQEFRWRKQPLRDIPSDLTGTLDVGPIEPDGTVVVTGAVSSAQVLRSIEVLDGPDTVFMYDPHNPHPDANAPLRVKISLQSSISVPTEGLRGEVRRKGPRDTQVVWSLESSRCTTSPQSVVVDVPADEIASTVFEVAVPPYFEGTVSAEHVAAHGAYSFAADRGLNMLFRRWLCLDEIPPPCGVTNATFSFRLRPSSPDTVLRLQTVDAKYGIGLPAVRALARSTGRRVRAAFYGRDTDNVGDVEFAKSRAVAVDYKFDSGDGGVLTSGAGFGWDGMLGGNCALVAGYGYGDGIYGSALQENGISENTPGWPMTVPRYVKEADGTSALEFHDCSFVSLPQQLVPIQAGFTLEMDVKPEGVSDKQGLLSSGGNYFTLWIENGRVYADMFMRNLYFNPSTRSSVTAEGPKIVAGEWQRIVVRYDCRTLRVDVGSAAGKPVTASGELMYPRYMALGTLGDNGFFRGRMRKLSVRPYQSEYMPGTTYFIR